jgi:hypothetical protein
LLDFFVHPALFWLFGRKDAEEQMRAAEFDEAEILRDREPVHELQPGVGEAQPVT